MSKAGFRFQFLKVLVSLCLGSAGTLVLANECTRNARLILGEAAEEIPALLQRLNQDFLRFENAWRKESFPAFQNLIRELNELQTGIGMISDDIDRDPAFLELLRKVIFSKSPRILEAELLSLRKDANYFEALRMAVRLRWVGRALFRSVNSAARFMAGEEKKYFHFYRAQNFTEFFEYLYWDTAHPVLSMVSPFPLPANRAPTAGIFRALWKNPSFEPSAAQWEVLRRFRADEMFRDQRAFQQARPRWSTLRRWAGSAAELAKFVSFAYVAWHAREISNGGFLSLDEFLREKKSGVNNVAYLIFDSVPYPHLALLMNNSVYSYGQSHLKVEDPRSYLDHRKIEELMKARGLISESTREEEGSGAKVLQKLIDVTGIKNWPQSVEVVALQFTRAEIEALSLEFESNRGKRYENSTMINDCATMLIRVLAKHTWMGSMRLIDASPSQIMMHLSGLKLQEPRIKEVFQVTIQDHDKVQMHFLRNLWINSMESKLFINMFFINQVFRVYLDLGGEEKLQAHDPETKDFLDRELQQESLEDIENDVQIQLFEKQIQAVHAKTNTDELKEAIEAYFNDEILALETTLKTGATPLPQRVMNGQKIELLKEKRRQLLEKLSAAITER